MSDKRFWEIDVLRGTAIIMMILYHFIYDLNFFDIYNMDISSGFWWFFARFTASIFIFVVGISLTLSYQKNKIFKNYLKRGATIFFWGLMITLMTWLFLQRGFIIFGILHFIGLSVVLGYFFVKYRKLNLLLGSLIILAGIYLQTMAFDFNWLIWLGFIPAGLYTVDYFPLLPWFGLVLFGIAFGNTYYINKKRIFPDTDSLIVKCFSFLGRNSLLIYLIHQPIVIFLIYLFTIM